MKNTKTSKTNAENLLENILNPLVKAYEGIKIGLELHKEKMVQKYAILFFQALMLQPKEKILALYEEMHNDPYFKFLDYLPQRLFQDTLLKYLEFVADILKKDQIKFIRQAIESLDKKDIKGKKAIVNKLYHMEMKVIVSKNLLEDYSVSLISSYAKKVNDTELVSSVDSYCERRILSFQNPTSLEDVKDPDSFWKLIQEINHSEKDAIKALIVATDVLMRRSTMGDKNELSIKYNDILKFYKPAYKIAVQLFAKEKSNLAYVGNILKEAGVQKTYSKKPEARIMAIAYVEFMLNHNHLHVKWIEEVGKWLAVYNLDKDMLDLISKPVIEKLLAQGQIELADTVSKFTGYKIPEDSVEKAVLVILMERANLMKEVNSFSEKLLDKYSLKRYSSDKDLRSEEFGKSIELTDRIDRVRAYFQHGLPKIDDIPVSNLADSYSGKILLATYESKVFLRTLNGTGGDMHRQILESFSKEIQRMGFAGSPNENGGAYIRMSASEKSCVIKDRSEDYGECDKNIAKEIVQQQFPDWTIVTEAAKNR
jgi:hypothetical protein